MKIGRINYHNSNITYNTAPDSETRLVCEQTCNSLTLIKTKSVRLYEICIIYLCIFVFVYFSKLMLMLINLTFMSFTAVRANLQTTVQSHYLTALQGFYSFAFIQQLPVLNNIMDFVVVLLKASTTFMSEPTSIYSMFH